MGRSHLKMTVPQNKGQRSNMESELKMFILGLNTLKIKGLSFFSTNNLHKAHRGLNITLLVG